MAADKARYYLEQSIPELHEYEKKKIFTKVSQPAFRAELKGPAQTQRTNIRRSKKSRRSPKSAATSNTASMRPAVAHSTSRDTRNTR
jgi:hypothetical protein